MSVPAVAVTGLGAIGCWGVGRDALARALAAGRPPEGGAALVPELDLTRWVPPAQARRLGRPSRWAVAAARMALEDAGLPTLEGRRVAVVLATAFGAVLFTEKLVRQILEEGPESAQPFYFSECVANAAAGQVAIAVGATAANVTVTQREAGPLLALARGAAEVREGRADVALVGGADEMSPLLRELLDRFHAGACAGEGASIAVLEREDDARSRRVAPLARIVGSISAFDPTASASDWGRGDATLARALAAGLLRLGRDPRTIDVIVSGASGATRGDGLEASVFRRVFGDAALPATETPKAVVGDYAGGHLAAAIVAASRGRILAGALAAGGAAAWAILERP